MRKHFFYDTKLGKVGIAELGGKITHLYFSETPPDSVLEETPLLASAAKQLREYFNGARRTFDLPLAPEGTAFQRSVWDRLREIPYGETRSYGEIAREIGNAKASRAVGMSNHRNPIAIVIPCHRVIGAGGKLVGYAGGLDIKRALLNLECGHSLPEGNS